MKPYIEKLNNHKGFQDWLKDNDDKKHEDK